MRTRGSAPKWYVNIKLGRRLAYTHTIVDLGPGQCLVMCTAEGPFRMEMTYTWESVGEGETPMTLRNRGAPSGFARIAAPLMAAAMRHANG